MCDHKITLPYSTRLLPNRIQPIDGRYDMHITPHTLVYINIRPFVATGDAIETLCASFYLLITSMEVRPRIPNKIHHINKIEMINRLPLLVHMYYCFPPMVLPDSYQYNNTPHSYVCLYILIFHLPLIMFLQVQICVICVEWE